MIWSNNSLKITTINSQFKLFFHLKTNIYFIINVSYYWKTKSNIN
jgi:hypothetical protein